MGGQKLNNAQQTIKISSKRYGSFSVFRNNSEEILKLDKMVYFCLTEPINLST